MFRICVYNWICVIGQKNIHVLDFFICYEKCLLMSVFNMNIVLRRFSWNTFLSVEKKAKLEVKAVCVVESTINNMNQLIITRKQTRKNLVHQFVNGQWTKTKKKKTISALLPLRMWMFSTQRLDDSNRNQKARQTSVWLLNTYVQTCYVTYRLRWIRITVTHGQNAHSINEEAILTAS